MKINDTVYKGWEIVFSDDDFVKHISFFQEFVDACGEPEVEAEANNSKAAIETQVMGDSVGWYT